MIDVIYSLLLNEKEIKEEFFKENNDLKLISIPSSIKLIEKSSFENCSSLTDISILSSVTLIGSSAFK